MDVTSVIGLLILCYLLNKFIDRFLQQWKISKVLDKFPGDPKHWLWGNLHQHPGFNVKGLEYLRKRVERFPRYCTFWTGNYFRGDLYLHHPEPLSVLLKTAEPKQMKSGVYRYFKHWLGNGLIFSSGEFWQRNRKLLTNVFHFEILKQYLIVKNKCTDIFLKHLEQYAKSGKSVEMFEKVGSLTMDVILRCTSSYESDVQTKGEQHQYLHAVTRLTLLISKRVLEPWNDYDFIYKFTKDGREFLKSSAYIHSISDDLIKTRKQFYETSSDKPQKDFLDVLLQAKDEDGNGLTDLEIREELDTFLFTGHDTTTSAISWILYSLAEHPEIQKRCQKEVDEIFEGRTDEELKWDDLQKLRYLTMCIKEGLRLHCPIHLIARELENPMVIDGIELPPGSLLWIDIYSLHHNPEVWPDPMKYDPDRFSLENIVNIDHYSFIPFSAGPRNCIGQNFALDEAKLVIARTLKRFSLSLDPERPTIPKPTVVMRTENGMFLKLKARNDNFQ